MEKLEKLKEQEKKRIQEQKAKKYEEEIREMNKNKELLVEIDFPYKKQLEEIQVVKNENHFDQNSKYLKFNDIPRVPTFLFTKHPS